MSQVHQYEISKNWLGFRSVKYSCPHCGERLRSPLGDAGKQDSCPNCNSPFLVPGKDSLERFKAAKEAAVERAAKLKAQLKKEKKDRKAQREAERARAQEEAAAQRAEQLRLAEEAKETSPQETDSVQQLDEIRESQESSFPWRSGGAVVTVAILLLIYFYVRSSDLRSKLSKCESWGVVTAKVSYSGLIGTNTVIFDLREGGSVSARRIDPVHLLMQFSDKLNLYTVNRVILARNGQNRFYISGSDLRQLSDSYAGGGRIWAFNNLPARVRRMDGSRAFGEWTGGWLGVLQKQTVDLDAFITEWTGYGNPSRYSAAPSYSTPPFDSEAALRSRVKDTLQDMEDNVPQTLQSIEDNLPDVMADMEEQMMKDAAKYGLSPAEVRAQLRDIEAKAREQIRGMEDDVREQIRGMEDDMMDSLRDSGW